MEIVLACSSKHNGVFEIGTGRDWPLLEIVKKMQELRENFKYDNTLLPTNNNERSADFMNLSSAKEVWRWKAKTSLVEGLVKTLEWWENK